MSCRFNLRLEYGRLRLCQFFLENMYNSNLKDIDRLDDADLELARIALEENIAKLSSLRGYVDDLLKLKAEKKVGAD